VRVERHEQEQHGDAREARGSHLPVEHRRREADLQPRRPDQVKVGDCVAELGRVDLHEGDD
jgi:hypothetical protein